MQAHAMWKGTGNADRYASEGSYNEQTLGVDSMALWDDQPFLAGSDNVTVQRMYSLGIDM